MRGDDRIAVLYLAPWVDLGGSDKGTIDWFRSIDHSRFAPSLITTQPSDNRWLHHVEPYAEEVWSLPDQMPGASFPAFILGFIQSRRIRVVHIMNSRLGFDLMPDMTCLPAPPAIVVQLHAEEPDRSGYLRYVAARYDNLVDRYSVTSHQLERALATYGIAPSRIAVIHSGVDAAGDFDPERVQPIGGLGEEPRILWPGRLTEQKDPHLTLDVVTALRRRGAQFSLHVVGDGHLKPELERRAAKLGIADVIRWHPPSQEMARWYLSSDVLLMTSVFEGVPYVVYESLAMGVPAVVPALPGNVEFMDGDAGVLVDPRDDVEAYASALETLLADEPRRRAMGARSRTRMLTQYSLRDMAARHEELYTEVLRRRPAAARRHGDDRRDDGEEQLDLAALTLERSPPPERTVGIVVPCHRHGLFIDECIESIRAQTLPASQVVVVDDGSDDPETIQALRRLEHDGDVLVLRLPDNRGPSAARNRALRELRTSYVLPLDADDKLLPDALERMVRQLEQCPPDVGYVYPHARYFGTRNDDVVSPAYNLFLLMRSNYCPAPALFDRRAFEAGVEYSEQIVFGHEDWDLVLQLAERGLRGVPADGPTFLYRRRGLSRANAVEYGPAAFDEVIRGRHARLYEARRTIKATWAPALSVLLLEEAGDTWDPADLDGLAEQSCEDFEVIARPGADIPPGVQRGREVPGSDASWLASALSGARGRWVLVARPALAAAWRRRSFVEALIRELWSGGAPAVGLGTVAGPPTVALSRIDGDDVRRATPCGIAWGRSPEGRSQPADLGLTGSLLDDLVVALEAAAPIRWRRVPDEPAMPAVALNGGPR